MRGVRCARLANLEPDFQTVFIDDVNELIPPDRVVALEVSSVHIPEFHPAYPGIFDAYVLDILQRKGLLSRPSQCNILVSLIICLL